MRKRLWRMGALPCLLLAALTLSSCARADESPSAPAPTSVTVFTRSPQSFGETRTFGLALADVDLDGDEDLFVANYIGPSRLWLNDGDGVFSDSRQNFSGSTTPRVHDVEMEDLNGDSCPDIFLACHDAPSMVFLNDGSGGFPNVGQEIGSAADDPQRVVLGDVDCDGDVDAVLVFARSANALWLNDGRGGFARSGVGYGDRSSPEMLLADLNADGFVDYFLGFLAQPGEIWINDGSGDFSDAHQAVGDEAGCDDVESGDVDGDGDPDLVITSVESGVGVWLNRDGAGTFAVNGPCFHPGTFHMKLFDADLDGDLDLITSHMGEGNRLWLNDGSGSFSPTEQTLGVTWGFSFVVGKLDRDNDFDIVIGSESDGPEGAVVYFAE